MLQDGFGYKLVGLGSYKSDSNLMLITSGVATQKKQCRRSRADLSWVHRRSGWLAWCKEVQCGRCELGLLKEEEEEEKERWRATKGRVGSKQSWT